MTFQIRYLLLSTALALSLLAPAHAQTLTPDVIVSTGASLDYATHQPSARVLIGPKIASPLGIPTYAVVSYEQNVFKMRSSATATSQSNALTIKAGILQIPYHGKHWGVATLTDGGIVKYDTASLATFTGEVSVYWDIVGQFTQDKYHGWIGPVAREVSIAGLQVKPVYGLQLTTVFSRRE